MHPDADYLKELENLSIDLEKKIERVSILLKKILEDYHKTSESLLKELLIIFELIKKTSEMIKYEHNDRKDSAVNFLDRCFLDDEN